ncbi:MAG TPA: flagellar biosynthetic protein FliQ [Candidatus Baltobacteraceae bacterium]|nr:flagellar biosynthetic protein FliQ [Candidatus Baltobacteraceae bacterium]
MAAFDGLLREALIVAAVLCLPVLCVATIVGTLIAVFQAATQVQEQTLSLLPKLIAVGITVAIFGGFAMHVCAGLFIDVLSQIPALVRA